MRYLIIHISSLTGGTYAASVGNWIKQNDPESEVSLLVDDPELYHPFFPLLNFLPKQPTIALQTKVLRGTSFDEVIVADISKRAALMGKAAKAKQKSIFKPNPLSAIFKSKLSAETLPRPQDFFQVREGVQLLIEKKPIPSKGNILLAPFPEMRERVEWEQWRNIERLLPAGLTVMVLSANTKVKRHFKAEIEVVPPHQFYNALRDCKLVISAVNAYGLLAAQDGRPTVLFSKSELPFGATVSSVGWCSRIAELSVADFSNEEKFNYAVQLLRQSRVIAHETDTIPGLAAIATDEEAVERIFAIKKRDPSKSLIILCRDVRMVERHVRDIPEVAFKLWDKTGASPLTLILPASKGLPSSVVAADHSVAVRIPQNKFLQYMIHRAGAPIASTSANLSGKSSPQRLRDLDADLVERVDFVLDIPFKESSEDKETAQASTIIKVSRDGGCEIIRKGTMNQELADFLNSMSRS